MHRPCFLSPRSRAQWLKLAHRVEDALVGQGDWLEEDDPEVATIIEKTQRGRGKRAEQRAARKTPGDEAILAVRVDKVSTERHRIAGIQ